MALHRILSGRTTLKMGLEKVYADCYFVVGGTCWISDVTNWVFNQKCPYRSVTCSNIRTVNNQVYKKLKPKSRLPLIKSRLCAAGKNSVVVVLCYFRVYTVILLV